MPQKSSSTQYFRKVFPKFNVYSLILMSALLIFLIFIYLNSYFQLKTINIRGEISKDKIVGLENLQGTNLYFLSSESLANSIDKNNPAITVEEITKQYPNVLNLRLKQLEPVAQLKLN